MYSYKDFNTIPLFSLQNNSMVHYYYNSLVKKKKWGFEK